ncbi:MAG: putative sulfate/molybdate transporter [Halobellus sp.]|uniref:putative sulfate/molybdate transporter n=1 Tax=Halobellus sp. TaxID=1979212 RepID=UPI0035D51FFC
MDVFARISHREGIDFSWNELTGALGDSVTVLPIAVSVAALTELSLAHLLLGFAAFQIVWGVHYGLPISVEPMKALAALVIAGSIGPSELAVAGLLAGGVLFAVGSTGTLARIERHVDRPVIRGVQLSVGLVLLRTGVELSLGGPVLALVAVGVVIGSLALGHRRASTLAVLGAGVAVAVWRAGLPTPQLPALVVATPDLSGVSTEAVGATIGQLAMTVGNAAVATSLLFSDYFDSEVSADELATSMGIMNLLAIPFGAMPMCHGSGGVAGKYAFGARTAGANLILGLLYALATVLAVGVIAAFPMSMLGVVLAVIAIELARTGLATDDFALTVAVGLVGVLVNVGVAFIVGIAAAQIRKQAL